jgi:cytochrome c-type protein NapC
MADNNYQEYRKTIHAHSKTGVKATCADCHVPREFPDVFVRKVLAVNDIYHHLAGTIDTPEKFQARRLELAKKVWVRMKTTDSRECRNCHDTAAMKREEQGKVAQKEHEQLFAGTRTCIDCHYGIAHKEPPGGFEPDDVMAQR